MAQAGRTFRIFVSSTFTDLQEERNILQREVFPALKQLCAANGCQFQAIDLRWGVGEEAGLDQRTMKICMEELKRCQRTTPRPNFILLLGDRYGWRPPPEEIPADEFTQMLAVVSGDEEKELLAAWYRRDENAVPPVYNLQPRTGAFVDTAVWEKEVERKLRSILLQAVEKMRLSPDKRVKYTASATEQEIISGALSVADAREHVFCFFRTIAELPGDQRAEDFVDLKDDGKPDPGARKLLSGLKKRLEDYLPAGNIYRYKARWTGAGVTTNHLEELCRDVYSSLERVIQNQIEQIKARPYLEKEIEDHARFGQERARFFVGRASILEKIGAYMAGTSPHPLAIHGEGGSGKSALSAFALEQALKEQPRAEIVFRFIGATLNSSDVRSLLEDLCRQVSRAYGKEEALPTAYEELVPEFPGRLALATAEKPLVLFLDSLDQLSAAHHARSLAWLPEKLPENVRLVVTTRPGDCLAALESKLPPDNILELGPLSQTEGERLLDCWLADAGRTLAFFQRKEVLDNFAVCRWPLYIRLAFEEARLWKSYTEEIKLSPGKEGIIQENLFRRLEADHGRMLIARSLGYLAATREMSGLAEDELLEILSADTEFFADFQSKARHEPPEQKLPVAVWARLYYDMEPYLSARNHEGTALLTFFHRELGEAAGSRYLAEDEIKYQQLLADYFLSKADPLVEPPKKERKRSWQGAPRALSELPYHLARAGRWDQLFETLVDFTFLEEKAARVGVQENIDAQGNRTTAYTGALALLEDYDLALSDFPKE